MKSTLTNMVLVLGAITLVASIAVSGFYILTKDAIEAANRNKINGAIEEVMPGFDNTPSQEFFMALPLDTVNFQSDSLKVYPAKKGDELMGYAIESYSNQGYGGKIELMVGILVDGTIKNVSVVSESETPGLGHKMSTDSILVSQFRNVDPNKKKLMVKKRDGGDIDAITAATISSRAFCDAVNRALSVSDRLHGRDDAVTGATSIEKED